MNSARDLAIDIGRAISLQRPVQSFTVYNEAYDDSIDPLSAEYISILYTGVSNEAARWLRELLNSPITRAEWLQG